MKQNKIQKKIIIFLILIFLNTYGFWAVFSRSSALNAPLWQGILGMILIGLTSLLPYVPKWLLIGRPHILIVQVYYVIRLIILFVSIFLLFGNSFLSLIEVVFGYFLLLLISIFSIKNERHFRSID